ncbi:MAG TPA: histidine kinase [Actinomycetota bacterium]|nr:histidine kinase [Actinomycetota bacterium]
MSSSDDVAVSSTDPAREQRLRILAYVVFGFVVAGFVLRVVLNVLNGPARSDLETGSVLDTALMIFPVVGLLLAVKRPRNPLGWLLLGIGWAFVASPGAAYARYATVTHDGDLPGAGLAIAVDAPMWVVFIGLSGFVLMLFPDGHLPSPRWRWFARLCAAGLTALFVTILLSPGQGADYDLPHVENPLAVEALRDAAWILTLVVFAPVTVLGGAIALIRRRRRTEDPVQRLQLRWVTWAAGVGAAAYVVAIVPSAVFGLDPDAELPSLLGSIAVMTFLLIPITIAIAVLRYRLYDIDFVVRKTVVFAVLATFIAVVYAAIVVGVGALVGSGAGDPILSAAAAAVVAMAFQPLRARARRLADRVVYGERATPYEVLGTFGDQLAGTYSSDDVVPRIARVLAEGVGADRARVWLRVGDDLRVVAAWPGEDGAARDDFTTEVRHQGEVLGALSVAMPADEPIDPTKEELVRHLAGQAGLVLSNARLTEELRARLDDLRAAQKRLVTAQDAERKRLERNIHDGAQQQLVALAVKLRLAEQLSTRDAERTREALVQLQADTTQTLEDLRDLARGIYPPLLADEGLGAALGAQARRAAFPVEVDVALDRRYPPEVEAAVYFSVLEALQNVAKYADAGSASVRVSADGSDLAFDVTDDGRGFDPSATGYGTGLQGIADRLGALDGRVDVISVPGRGTSIRGRVPVHDPVAPGDVFERQEALT